MKFYLSCWNYGYHVHSDSFYFDLYQLAAFLVKEHYGEVHLITDNIGEEKFKKTNIFSSIDTRLEEVPKNLNVIWALGKIYAYKLISEKKEPFMHIDGDVLLFNPLPKELLKKDLLCQSIEKYAYKSYHVKNFTKSIPNPFFLKKHKISWAPNVGIIGGQNVDFINYYANEAIKIATDNKNQEFFMTTNFDPSFGPPCIIEQYYLGLLSDLKSIEISYLLDYGKAEELKYTHIWGAKWPERKRLKKEIETLMVRYGLKSL